MLPLERRRACRQESHCSGARVGNGAWESRTECESNSAPSVSSSHEPPRDTRPRSCLGHGDKASVECHRMSDEELGGWLARNIKAMGEARGVGGGGWVGGCGETGSEGGATRRWPCCTGWRRHCRYRWRSWWRSPGRAPVTTRRKACPCGSGGRASYASCCRIRCRAWTSNGWSYRIKHGSREFPTHPARASTWYASREPWRWWRAASASCWSRGTWWCSAATRSTHTRTWAGRGGWASRWCSWRLRCAEPRSPTRHRRFLMTAPLVHPGRESALG